MYILPIMLASILAANNEIQPISGRDKVLDYHWVNTRITGHVPTKRKDLQRMLQGAEITFGPYYCCTSRAEGEQGNAAQVGRRRGGRAVSKRTWQQGGKRDTRQRGNQGPKRENTERRRRGGAERAGEN